MCCRAILYQILCIVDLILDALFYNNIIVFQGVERYLYNSLICDIILDSYIFNCSSSINAFIL